MDDNPDVFSSVPIGLSAVLRGRSGAFKGASALLRMPELEAFAPIIAVHSFAPTEAVCKRDCAPPCMRARCAGHLTDSASDSRDRAGKALPLRLWRRMP